MEQTPTIPMQYLRNPDVVLREEDEDGGLLFNPDTNQVKVVNPTGLFIWKQFEQAQDIKAVTGLILSAFEDASEETVQTDLQEFLDELMRTGFIGTVETNSSVE